jgi:hypothetical protein
MWYEAKYVKYPPRSNLTASRRYLKAGYKAFIWVRIHIHNPKEINGGAWNTGDGTNWHNITTNPIE